MNKKLTQEQRNFAYGKIMGHYGVDAQMLKAVEEMMELCAIIMQAQNRPKQELIDLFTDIDFKEELADVNIMLAQLTMFQEAVSWEKAQAYANEDTPAEDWFYEISTNSVTDFKINRTTGNIDEELAERLEPTAEEEAKTAEE